MKPGTPGFVPERLTEAREARGLTQLALADQVGVSRASITKYESTGNQHSTPGPDVLERIALVLGLPTGFFLRPVKQRVQSATYLRALRSVAKIACDRADKQLGWAADIAESIGELVVLPKVDFPNFTIKDPVQLSDDDIEHLAAQARRHWGLGENPISNVVLLLENKGAIVMRCEVGSPKLDGLSRWTDDRPTILLASDKVSGPRGRFDAAHELGHLLLHRSVAPARLRSTTEWQFFENQAHRFAASFLFPEKSFHEEVVLVDLDALQPLKLRWKVSLKMMILRALNLGIIGEARADQLQGNYRRRGYRTREPLDDSIEPERPRLLRRAVELVLKDRGASEVLSRLPYSVDDFERITGLPKAFFSDDEGVLLTLKPRASSNGLFDSLPSSLGDVVPFPSRTTGQE